MSMYKPLTRNQTLVIAILQKADRPLSAYAILELLRDQGFKAPLQVYRALKVLIKKGLAHRLESLNAFVACSDNDCHRAGMIAFAICDKCGQVSEFSDFVLRQRLEGWAQHEGFRATRSVVEIQGKCARCVHDL